MSFRIDTIKSDSFKQTYFITLNTFIYFEYEAKRTELNS